MKHTEGRLEKGKEATPTTKDLCLKSSGLIGAMH